MKQPTLFAMIGAGILILIRLFYIIISFNILTYSSNFNIVTEILDLTASIAIFNFFYVLYNKQNNKPEDDK
ncbi:hypothetical protein ABF176_001791 [Flavobacterium psychrophilum]|uniref:hypothetical protein n=1 Tax=Flavobacterium psychrophilum TaxID=96345 RepID=UPI000B7C0D13|nr:hypothetical protein [Flavobacterium psychrophilum]ELM3644285.1 hypothetical protein [Flavobacterium psychrophilum]SNB01607.1 hypothetical protein KU05112810_100053 [Flavobacterium psychrophilum]